MDDRAFISVFTPSRTAPDDLEAIHMQRHGMLEDAVERARESATTGNKHHLLFVGPRGTGKTHLVTLLVHRLGQARDLDQCLRIAWLNEDETSTTLLELLRRIYDALRKRYPDEFAPESLEPIFDAATDEAERMLAELLLGSLQDRTLLVVVENLDALFEGLGKSGQHKLRAFIQEHPVMALVATAQRLVDDIAKRKNAFFGFFQTEQLKALSVEEAGELLKKIATRNDQPEVAAFLDSPTGRSRVRALHHLSGGNHRIYIVLSQFITRDSIDALVEPFSKMIDEMTPYYQERIRWLPPQQRKIVEFLCSCERPTPVKAVARRLFASQQSISSQLKDLRGKGYVQSAQRGRESLYEIAEPLMRVCVEVKENQSHAPLRILIDFLRVWYDGRELTERLRDCGSAGRARAYLQGAVEKNQALGNLRKELLVRGFRAELSEQLGVEHARQWGPRIEAYAEASEELVLACGEWAKGKEAEALAILEELVDDEAQSPSVKALALLLSAEVCFRRGDLDSATKYLDSSLKQPQASVEEVARALYNRGVTYGQLGDTDRAIADYSAVIDLPQAPVGRIAEALCNRGWTYGWLGDTDRAIADYSAVIDLPQAPVEQVAKALCNRGVTYGRLGDTDRVVADCSAVIDLPQAPVEQIAKALYNRGMTYWQLGEVERSKPDIRAVLDLEGAPTKTRLDSHLVLAEIGIATGSWNAGVSSLAQGLGEGRDKPEQYLGDATGVIGAFFESGATPSIQRKRARELAEIYRDNDAVSQLGEAITQHIGSLYSGGGGLPATDTLESWASSWEAAGEDIAAFRLPLRILRTGVEFLKSGGNDHGVLTTLNQEERNILEQALGLESEA